MRAVRYYLEEALLSLWRGRRTNLIAVLTITAAVFVVGGFLLVTANLERVLGRWSSAAEFSVFLRDEVTPDARRALEQTLTTSRLVARHEFVSKEQALARFRQDFPDLAGGLSGLPENPFPASFEVQLQPGATGTGLEAFAASLSRAEGVADIRYDRQWLDRLQAAVGLVRWAGGALAAMLVLAAALTVANVIRLALHARRDEIEIMQLVGTPLAYIRGPFVVEGTIQGGAGSALALGLLWVIYAVVRVRYGALAAGVFGPEPLGFVSPEAAALLGVGGLLVGCVGGYVAARNVR